MLKIRSISVKWLMFLSFFCCPYKCSASSTSTDNITSFSIDMAHYWWTEQPQPRYNRMETHNSKTTAAYRCRIHHWINSNHAFHEKKRGCVCEDLNIIKIIFNFWCYMCVVYRFCYTLSATYFSWCATLNICIRCNIYKIYCYSSCFFSILWNEYISISEDFCNTFVEF